VRGNYIGIGEEKRKYPFSGNNSKTAPTKKKAQKSRGRKKGNRESQTGQNLGGGWRRR